MDQIRGLPHLSHYGRGYWQVLIIALLIGLSGCTGGSSSQSVDSYTSAADNANGQNNSGNQSGVEGAPFVDAGRDHIADPNVIVELSGNAVAAQDANITRVTWTQVDGPSVTLLSPDHLKTIVLTPDITVATQLRFQLRAEDSKGRIGYDRATLTVQPLQSFVRVVGGLVQENAGTAEFELRMNKPNTQPVIVTYSSVDGTAKAGQDYIPLSGSINIDPGQTTAKIPVVILDDSLVEGPESFSLKITGVTNGETSAATGSMVIVDNDSPFVSDFTDVTDVELGVQTTSNAIAISGLLSPASIQVQGGEYSIDGGAFTSLPGTVSNGQSIRVRVNTSTQINTTTTAVVTISGISKTFSATTGRPAIADISFANAEFGDCVKTTASANSWIYDDEVTSLTCSGIGAIGNIDSAQEVDNFGNLRSLTISSNRLTALDLSKNTALTYLNLYENQFTTIDLSANTALTTLRLGHNQIVSIDLSSNRALTDVDLSNNQLSSINLSAITALTSLDLSHNLFSTIDLSTNHALRSLYLYSNQLAAIDVTANPQLQTLYLNSNHLSTIDLSANSALKQLNLEINHFVAIDLSQNTALLLLYLGGNQLTAIDLSSNTALTLLALESNQLTTINLDNNTALNTANLTGNPFDGATLAYLSGLSASIPNLYY